jgi:dTDP-4-dehydrorhamnose 3,5-epimerase-like enzyme
MEASKLTYLEVTDSGDERGSSFPVPGSWFSEAFPVRDGHITTLLPGHTRGNHFHRTRQEFFVVMFDDLWSLHWDTGEGTPCQYRQFEGRGTVLVRIQPLASHAIRNDGSDLLRLVGLTDGAYDPVTPDAFPRKVTSP